MIPRLPAGRSIGPGLVRIAARLIREAARRLGRSPVTTAETVHAVRVALKRARSTLRLLEKAGADWARMPRQRLTTQARRLTSAREVAVVTGLAARLQRRKRGSQRELARLLLKFFRPVNLADPVGLSAALDWEAALLEYVPAPVITRQDLGRLLRRSLDRAGRRQREAAARPTPVKVHEWRKAVIILRDQTGLAAAIWPDGSGRAHRILIRLARALGAVRDALLLEAGFKRLRVGRALQAPRRRLGAKLQARRRNRTAGLICAWPTHARRLNRLLAEPGPGSRRASRTHTGATGAA